MHLIGFIGALFIAACISLFIKIWREWSWRRTFFFYIGVLAVGAIAVSINLWLQEPVDLDRDDVVGTYTIDKEIFSGEQAEWQHKNFKLELTTDHLVLYRKIDGGFKPVDSADVQWEYEEDHKWSLKDPPENHYFFTTTPLCIRSHWNFYYVFNTKCCGNMYFRKTGS